MFVFLCIFIIALYLIHLPIQIEIASSSDMQKGQGGVKIKVIYIPIFSAEGLLKTRSAIEGDLILKHHHNRKKLNLKLNRKTFNETVKSIKSFNFSMIGNLDMRRISLNLTYGSGDALKTALRLSAIRMVFYSIISVFKSKQHIIISEQFTPDYNAQTLKGDIIGIFSLSIGDIIYGFLIGKIKQFRKRLRVKKARANQGEAAI